MPTQPKFLRYMPPKASIWGHSMKRMKPAKMRAGFQAFLDQAVLRYESNGPVDCYVSVNSGGESQQNATAFIRSFLSENHLPAEWDDSAGGRYVDEAVFERCLDWFVEHWESFSRLKKDFFYSSFCLHRDFHVQAWKFDPALEDLNLQGVLGEDYGDYPYVGTMLEFRTLAEYRWVADIAQQTLGIRFNDKHLRPKSAWAE